jgi:hypothetical protein
MKFYSGLCSLFLVLIFQITFANDHQHKTDSQNDDVEIRQLLGTAWDKPESKLLVEPLIIVNDYAIAGWRQNKRGGRALLTKHHGKWTVILCGGDGIKNVETLDEIGMPVTTRDLLLQKLTSAESQLSAETLALFASFGKTIKMESGHH